MEQFPLVPKKEKREKDEEEDDDYFIILYIYICQGVRWNITNSYSENEIIL